MTPIMCGECLHFDRDPLNPAQGMGACEKRMGYFYPGQVHRCDGFESIETAPEPD